MNSSNTTVHEATVPENQDVNMLDQTAANITKKQFVPPTADSHSLFVDLNEDPVTNPLLDHILEIFHRYIRSLNNVKGDGNCGFRSVSVGLGLDENTWPLIRQELLQELSITSTITQIY
ncbi:probable terpene synthase 6 [Tanacetum coccineum]